MSLLDGMLFIKYCSTDDPILLMVHIHRGIGPTTEISYGIANGSSQFRFPVMLMWRLLKRYRLSNNGTDTGIDNGYCMNMFHAL